MHTTRRLRSIAAVAGALSLGAVATGVSTAPAAARPDASVARTAAVASRASRTTEGRGHDAPVIEDVRTVSDHAYEIARTVTGAGDARRVVFTAIDLRTGRSFALNG